MNQRWTTKQKMTQMNEEEKQEEDKEEEKDRQPEKSTRLYPTFSEVASSTFLAAKSR